MISSIFNGIYNVIYYTTTVVGTVSVLSGGFLYMTKPTDDSLKEYIRSRNNAASNSLSNKALNVIGLQFTDITIKDYVFVKYATTSSALPGKDMQLIGILQSWYPLNN
jgi:hypothetical protein